MEQISLCNTILRDENIKEDYKEKISFGSHFGVTQKKRIDPQVLFLLEQRLEGPSTFS